MLQQLNIYTQNDLQLNKELNTYLKKKQTYMDKNDQSKAEKDTIIT